MVAPLISTAGSCRSTSIGSPLAVACSSPSAMAFDEQELIARRASSDWSRSSNIPRSMVPATSPYTCSSRSDNHAGEAEWPAAGVRGGARVWPLLASPSSPRRVVPVIVQELMRVVLAVPDVDAMPAGESPCQPDRFVSLGRCELGQAGMLSNAASASIPRLPDNHEVAVLGHGCCQTAPVGTRRLVTGRTGRLLFAAVAVCRRGLRRRGPVMSMSRTHDAHLPHNPSWPGSVGGAARERFSCVCCRSSVPARPSRPRRPTSRD